MADKQISQLTEATTMNTTDLYIIEQAGTAKKLTGQRMIDFLTATADGHGGIASIAKTGTENLVDTYTITYADQQTSTFTVTNGAKGDTGDAAHVYIKYAHINPISNPGTSIFSDPSSVPNGAVFIGFCITTAGSAPSSASSYTWSEYKGEKGDPISSVQRTSGTGTAGTNDTYTVYVGTTSVGEFTVHNGADGEGSAGSSAPLGGAYSGVVGISESFSREDHQHPFQSASDTATTEGNSVQDRLNNLKIQTYTSVTQLSLNGSALVSGSATIAQAWAAIPNNSVLIADASQFLSSSLPKTNGTVEVSKATGTGNGGWIAFYGKTASDGRYEMHLTGTGSGIVPDGTWVGLLPASTLSFSRSGSLYLATVSNLSYAENSLRYALNADGSIGKIYGSVTVTVGSSFSGSNASIAVYTDSGKTTRLTVASPSSSYTINTAGVTFRNSSTGTNISDVQRTYISTGNIAVDTSGRITLELSSLTYSGSVGNVHHYQYPASLYIFADFGDPVISNS